MTPDRERLLPEAKKLFEYLAQVQRLRQVPVRTAKQYEQLHWLADFPDHDAVRSAHRVAAPEHDLPLFTIDRVVREAVPEPGADIAPWISGVRDVPGTPPTVRPSLPVALAGGLEPRQTPHGPGDTVHLEDEPSLGAEIDHYLTQWHSWARVDHDNRPVRELYTELFDAHQTAQAHSESYELVLGVGALSWKPEDHDPVQRHLFTFPVSLSFDDTTGTITAVREFGAKPMAVELDMLDPAVLPRQISDLRAAALGYEAHPLDRDSIRTEVARFTHALDAQGAHLDDDTPAPVTPDLRTTYAPALILRRRSQQGLLEMFETIREQLDELGEVPPGLLPLVDPDHTPATEPDDTPGGLVAIDDEMFLPLPVNERQLRVIQAVDKQAQVVVQGPPGTGKTHTAAALLAHLLAQGKRVLVTAHTDRALHEVRDKLPADIRPLSVAVVGNSQSELSDLRVAVETISRRADDHDPGDSRRSIEQHLATIERLRRDRSESYSALRQSRQAETAVRATGPYRGTLAAIAQQVEAAVPRHSWLTALGPVAAASTSPLASAEAHEWLTLLDDLDIAADEDECRRALPALDTLPLPADLAATMEAEASAADRAHEHAARRDHRLYPDVAALAEGVRTDLHVRTSTLASHLGDLESRSRGWVADALQDVRTGRARTWQARADQITQLLEECRPSVTAVGPLTQVALTSDNPAPLEVMARSLFAHLTQGGQVKLRADGTPKIGAFASKVIKESQPFFTQVLVNGLPATSPESIQAFLDHTNATRILDALDRVWPADVEVPMEDTLGERLQWHVTELDQLRQVLSVGDALSRAEEWVGEQGLTDPNWADLTEIRNYAALVEATTTAETLHTLRAPLESLLERLTDHAARNDASPVVAALADAVERRDRNAWASAHARLRHLHDVHARVLRRDHLADRLRAGAPHLQHAVATTHSDPGWSERLAGLDEAWTWAVARAWVGEQESVDVNALQRHLDHVEQQIRDETSALAAARAWAHAVDGSRMSGTSRAHLRQYASLVRRLGKGTGKYADKQRQEIKAALDECRPSVPVWIMPIYRIAEQFRVENDMFDVVLVDEASQAGLEASFLQYLAPKIIVIGDDKQVSPSAVGVDQQQLRDLADQYLGDNPFKASWQDPKRSYFDEATMRFGGKITLVEHRRCVPEIIGFSNTIAYEPENIRLIPVRQRPAGALEPVRSVHVADGFERGRTNPAEADAVVAQLLACLKDPVYDGKTFGVISLSGKEQAKLIQNKLASILPPEVWPERELRCGDAADFQGSERDVVFLSMVKAVEPGRRIGALTSEMYVQRYNVAASRAKDQMWLFHSLLLSDLGNPEDMRHALLEYVTHVEARQQRSDDRVLQSAVPDAERVEPFDSLFEQRIFNRVHGRGYSVIPQYPAEGYRIDLVVVGPHGNLAIECDGDHWHGPDRYLSDLARQRDLERCGWTFFRIRESAFYLDPEEALAGLWPQLEALTAAEKPRSAGEPVPGTVTDASLDEALEAVLAAVPDTADVRDDPAPAPAGGALSPLPEPTNDPAATALATLPPPAVRTVATPTAPVPYREYSGAAVPTHLAASKDQIIDSLVEVVRAEGPVRGSRLLTAYVKASLGQKVGSQIAKDLNSAISSAVRTKRLVEDNPLSEAGIKPRTYRLPEQPLHRVRTLGPRSLDEVPPLELAALIERTRSALGSGTDTTIVFRAVLDELDLKRLTPNVAVTLTRAATLGAVVELD